MYAVLLTLAYIADIAAINRNLGSGIVWAAYT